VSRREHELLELYGRFRVEDQLGFYRRRRESFDRATDQAVVLSAVLLGLTAAAGALAGSATTHTRVWAALAAIMPILATTLAAYVALYAFQNQSKIYTDAVRALAATERDTPDLSRLPDEPARAAAVRDYIEQTESVFRREQDQWGQLTTSIAVADTLHR
jgi:hypothetical protein